MSGTLLHPRLETYIETVCAQVKNREAHKLIREDINGHFTDALEDELERGWNEEEAVLRAIERLGQPEELGRSFHLIHQRRVDWPAIMCLAMLSFLGILVTIGNMRDMPFGQQDTMPWNTIAGVALGLGLGAAVFFANPRHIQKMWPLLLFGTAVLMLVTLVVGSSSRPFWGPKSLDGFDVFTMSPYLLALGLAGALSCERWKSHWRAWLLVFTVALMQILFALDGSPVLIVADIMLFVALVSHREVLWRFAVVAVPALVLGVRMTLIRLPLRYVVERFTIAFHAGTAPESIGYENYQTQLLVQNAGWFGHGMGGHPFLLAGSHGVFAFAELINLFGWSAGAVLAGVVIWLIARLWKRGMTLSQPFAYQSFLCLMTLLSFQLIYPMMIGLGVFPIIGVKMPFVSGGPLPTILALSSFGWLLNLLKRTEYRYQRAVEM